ncbi:MAG: HAMP domain-containing histidine kinase [Myxococcales bacterium]|nr:HAMP domain-containing histidine kinase [Myxococcales bacterium]
MRGSWLIRTIDRSIPAALHLEPEAQLRSRVLVASCATIVGFAFAGLLVRLATAPFDRGAVVGFVVLVCIAGLPYVQWATRSYRVAGVLLVGIVMVALPSFHLLLWMFPAPALTLFPMLTLMGSFLVGARVGLLLAALGSLIIVGLRLGLPPPDLGQLGGLSWTFAALGSAMCMISAMVAIAYESARARSQARLQAAVIAFEQAHARAEAESHSKTEFLRNVSHELRTPLNAILGYGELVREALADEGNHRHAEDIDSIRDASEQLLALINDLLDISRIEAGVIDLEFKAVAPHELLRRVVATALPLAAANGDALTLEAAPGLPTVITDAQRLHQIVLNLVGNACKFTRGGTIVVAATTEDEALVIRVRDDGVGMTPAECARLFEPFVQVHASPAVRRQGSGLGLALSRRLVEQLGGGIAVRSEPGKGSEFTVRLPLRRAALPAV